MGDRRFVEQPAASTPRSDGAFSRWRKQARDTIVKRGMKVMCGSADFVPASAADDVPLISGGLRLAWLRALGAAGVEDVVAVSGLGYRFVCHIGDLAEFPYYHRRAFEKELALCAAWLGGEEKPVIYDLGANVGFISTHLAQILEPQSPIIYAFEPAPPTYAKLVRSVSRLGLGARVRPIAAAVVDEARDVLIAVSAQNSMLSQVVHAAAEGSLRNGHVWAAGVTLDGFSAEFGTHPTLVKMDVEGSEVAVLRGAQRLLSHGNPPAILFEHNPVTLAEYGATPRALRELLAGYRFYYVDDLDGQMLPFGHPVADLGAIDWTCNLFAAPAGQATDERWPSVVGEAERRLRGKRRSGRKQGWSG